MDGKDEEGLEAVAGVRVVPKVLFAGGDKGVEAGVVLAELGEAVEDGAARGGVVGVEGDHGRDVEGAKEVGDARAAAPVGEARAERGEEAAVEADDGLKVRKERAEVVRGDDGPPALERLPQRRHEHAHEVRERRHVRRLRVADLVRDPRPVQLRPRRLQHRVPSVHRLDQNHTFFPCSCSCSCVRPRCSSCC